MLLLREEFGDEVQSWCVNLSSFMVMGLVVGRSSSMFVLFAFAGCSNVSRQKADGDAPPAR